MIREQRQRASHQKISNQHQIDTRGIHPTPMNVKSSDATPEQHDPNKVENANIEGEGIDTNNQIPPT